MKRNIRNLTDKEGQEILDFVYPDKKYKDFKEFSFDPILSEHGEGQRITFAGRSIIGLLYHGDQDTLILHFDNTKVIQWLYINDYNIEEQLEDIAHLSEWEDAADDLSYGVYELSRGQEMFREDLKKNWTLDYVVGKCTELYETYINKTYE